MRKRFLLRSLVTGTALALSLVAGTAQAQERPTDPSTIDLLDVLVEKGVLSRADADGVLSEARKRSEVRETAVRVPYVPEALRNQIKDEVRTEVLQTAKAEGWAAPNSVPSWLDRIKFSGDLRARAEGLLNQGSNVPYLVDINAVNANGRFTVLDAVPLLRTTGDRIRIRARPRFGAEMKINDHVDAGIRFVAGDQRDTNSTSETFTRNFGRYTVGFDRAFIRINPFKDGDTFAKTNVIVGKFDNPFLSTEAMFDRDLQFEGISATIAARFGGDDGTTSVFATAGAFPLDDFEFNSPSRYLLAGQIGAGAEPIDGLRLKVAGGLFHYEGLQGQLSSFGMRDQEGTAASRVQFGNSLFNIRRDSSVVNTLLYGLSADFTVASIYAKAEFDLNPVLVASLEFEAGRNIAFEERDLIARGGPAGSGDTLFHGRGRIGHREMDLSGAWALSAGYRRIEADATPDLFNDSDFGVGGTDQKGSVVSASWTIFDKTTLTGSWLSARTIDLVDQFGLPAAPIDVDTVQLDLTVKF